MPREQKRVGKCPQENKVAKNSENLTDGFLRQLQYSLFFSKSQFFRFVQTGILVFDSRKTKKAVESFTESTAFNRTLSFYEILTPVYNKSKINVKKATYLLKQDNLPDHYNSYHYRFRLF